MVDTKDPDFLQRRLESTRRRQSKKLTPAQVEEIKALHLTRKYSQRDLAIRYKVSEATINHAIRTRWILDPDGTPRAVKSLRSPQRRFKKLSLELLHEIRAKYDTGRFTYFDLVHEYKVSLGTISNIVSPRKRPVAPTLGQRLQVLEKLDKSGAGQQTRAMTLGDMPRED